MHHLNSVFHAMTKRVAWSAFDKLVDEHGADDLVRRLTTRQQFLALLFGQLSGAKSLRELTGAMESHQGRLYHCGAKAPKRSTLADANGQRRRTKGCDEAPARERNGGHRCSYIGALRQRRRR